MKLLSHPFFATILLLSLPLILIGQNTDTIRLSLQVGEKYSSYTGAGSCIGSGGYTTSQLFPEGISYTTDEISERNFGIIRVNYTFDISPEIIPGKYEGEITYTILIGGSVCSERRKLFLIEIIEAEKPIVDFSVETSRLIKGGSVHFLNHTQNPVTEWYWDFGDKGSSNEFEPTHNYDSLGFFSVKLIASGPGGSDTLNIENLIEVVEEGSPGTIVWSYEAEDEIITTPVIDDQGSIYFGCQDGNLYSINQQGSLNWKTDLGWYTVFTPIVGKDGIIYACFQGSGTLFSLNPEGDIIWEFDIAEEIYSAPSLGPDGNIYFISISGKLFSVSNSGDENWSVDLDSEYFNEAYIIIDGEGLIYVGKSESVYCLSPNGSIVWKWSRDQIFKPDVEGLSLNAHGQVVVATNGTIYCIKDGITISEFDLNLEVRSPVVIGQNDHYICSSSYKPSITCLDKYGNNIWQHKFPNGFNYHNDVFCPIVGSENIVYALSQSDTLYAIEGESGRILWMLRMPHDIGNSYSSNPSPVIYNNQLILAGDNSHVYAVECQSKDLESTAWPAKYNNIRGTKSLLDPSPVVLYPANGTLNVPIDTSVIWTDIFEADSFEVQIDTSSIFDSNFLQSATLSGTEFQPSTFFYSTMYYMRVRHFRGDDTLKWSLNVKFYTKPKLPEKTINNSPANGSTLPAGPIVFSWERPDSSKQNLVLNGGAEAPVLVPQGNFPYWTTKWRNWQLFSPGLKGHYAFKANINDDPLVQSINIASYDMEQNPYLVACGYSKGVINQNFQIGFQFLGLSSDSILVDTTLLVKYISEDWQKFQHVLQVPPGATRLKYTLNRDRYSHSDGTFLFDEIELYATSDRVDLQISETDDFTGIDHEWSAFIMDSISLDIQGYNKQYFWRTHAVNVSGAGLWTDVWSFRTKSHPPLIPVLIAPYDGKVVDYPDLELKWNNSEYSDYFLLQLSQVSDFSNLEFEESGITETNHILNLSKEGEYFWRVGAINEDWDVVWSRVRMFTFQKNTTAIHQVFTKEPWVRLFPNPGKDEINIRYFLPESGPVGISLINTGGQEIKIVNGIRPRGNNDEKLLGNYLSPGIWFLQLNLNGHIFVEKFVIK